MTRKTVSLTWKFGMWQRPRRLFLTVLLNFKSFPTFEEAARFLFDRWTNSYLENIIMISTAINKQNWWNSFTRVTTSYTFKTIATKIIRIKPIRQNTHTKLTDMEDKKYISVKSIIKKITSYQSGFLTDMVLYDIST